MANNKNKVSTDKIPTRKDVSALDKVARSILSVVDPNYKEKSILDNKNQEFRSIIDRELNLSKGVSGGSIVDFIASMQINTAKQNGTYTKEMELHKDDLFTKDIGNVFSYYQEVYKNRYLELTDLKFIAKFIPSMGESVRTTLDAITSSDSISDTINFIFKLPASISEEDESAIRKEISRVEEELKLRKKIRNIVYKNTLVGGSNFVYRISYKELFEKYSALKSEEMKNKEVKTGSNIASNKKANESINVVDYMPAIESYVNHMDDNYDNKLVASEKNNILKSCQEYLPKITIDNTGIIYNVLESFSNFNVDELQVVMEAKEASKRNDKKQKSVLNGMMFTTDGTKDLNEAKAKAENFDITGTYIKYISSNNIVKVKAFEDTVIGYFVVHKTSKTKKNGRGLTNLQNHLFDNTRLAERKREDAVNKIIDTISSSILSSFSNKFVSENSEYKKLIADCIVANGIDNDYNVQFIPAEYIEEFKVNEDENGDGVSIISDSLFPCKLLLDLIIGKMSNYFNKTGTKNIAHVYKGPMNRHSLNQTDRIIRDLQESGISINDILTPNVMFNKLNRDNNIVMPMTSNGKKLIEFEQLEGQQIDMSTDYENKLEKMGVMASGVPSVIMDYEGQADFAKQIVSGNIKWAGRVCTYQSDLEPPTTSLYVYLLQNGNLNENQKEIVRTGLKVTLPRPRALFVGNNTEFLRSVVDGAETIAKLVYPDDNQEPNVAKMRAELILELVRDQANFFDWDKLDDANEKIMNKYKKKPSENPQEDNGGY